VRCGTAPKALGIPGNIGPKGEGEGGEFIGFLENEGLGFEFAEGGEFFPGVRVGGHEGKRRGGLLGR
jgi:hypothetical protein